MDREFGKGIRGNELCRATTLGRPVRHRVGRAIFEWRAGFRPKTWKAITGLTGLITSGVDLPGWWRNVSLDRSSFRKRVSGRAVVGASRDSELLWHHHIVRRDGRESEGGWPRREQWETPR